MKKIVKSPFLIIITFIILSCSDTDPTTPHDNLKIVADHTIVDEYINIPDNWINEVKKMQLSIIGESHSGGYAYGLELLEQSNPKYSANVIWSGEPEEPTDQHLRLVKTYRNVTGTGWIGSAGEEDFWTSQKAIDMIDNNLDYFRNTLNNNINVLGFGWCWDMTNGSIIDGWAGELLYPVDRSNTVTPWDIDTTSINLQDYLDAVVHYNNTHPDTVTIYTTGPVDIKSEKGYQRWQKHEAIRDWVDGNTGSIVFFDYADILTWNDNEQFLSTWYSGTGNTYSFPSLHPDNDAEYDGGSGSCHISQDGCLRLGKSLWWMLARIAGWPGSN